MSNAIILHGKPDDFEYYDRLEPTNSNFAWIPWIKKQCQLHEIDAQTPEVFRSFDAPYEHWKHELERYDITNDTILIGHSCGGGVLLRWLSENRDVRVKKLILVAPWFDPLRFMPETFGFDLFDFQRDVHLLDRIEDAVIFHSDDDQESIQKTLLSIQQTWPEFAVRTFHNYGHFCPPQVSYEFPELLEEIIASI